MTNRLGFNTLETNPSYWILIASLFSSLSIVTVRFIGNAFPLIALLVAKYIFVCFASFILLIYKKIPIFSKEIALHLLRFFFGGVSATLSIYFAQRLPVAVAQCCLYTTPIFVLIIRCIYSLIIEKRKVPWQQLLLGFLGFIGCVFILCPKGLDSLYETLFMGVSYGICSSSALLILCHIGRKDEPPLRSTFYFSTFCVFFGLIFLFFFSPPLDLSSDSNELLLLLLLGLITLGVQLSKTTGWSKGNVALNAVLTYTSLPCSILMGFFIFGERLSVTTVVGALLIVFVALNSIAFHRKIRLSFIIKK